MKNLSFALLMMSLVFGVLTITSFMMNFDFINNDLELLHLYYFTDHHTLGIIEPNKIMCDLIIGIAAILIPLVSCAVATALTFVEYLTPKKVLS